MFGEWLRNERLNRGMSQKELAKAIGLTYVVISNFENGYKFPSIRSIGLIAKYFGISIEEIRKMEGK